MISEANWRGRRLHFVGVGGSGMSGLAAICATLGAEVSGSDRADGPHLARLRGCGIRVAVGHAAENVDDGAEIVYSSAVKEDNVERAHARALGLTEIRRGEFLGELSRLRRCLAVAGTHGKTTTAAMTVHALRAAGVNAGYVIGAPLRDGSPSAEWRADEWLVVETDESDRSFLALEPEIAVVTNIAFEHMNNYNSLADIRDAFAAFLGRAERVVVPDQPDVLSLCGGRTPSVFGLQGLRVGPEGVGFSWRGHEVGLRVPGEHNARNAAAALEACRLAGADIDRAVSSLATFGGARRRLELVGATPAGARIYDDFAVHPNEVRASLTALRTIEAGRVIVVFEPVLYTRTLALASGLGESFSEADVVVVLELFAGSEAGQQHPGVSGRLVAQAAADHVELAAFIPDAADVRAYLESVLGPGDSCVLMGVSQVPWQLARDLVNPD